MSTNVSRGEDDAEHRYDFDDNVEYEDDNDDDDDGADTSGAKVTISNKTSTALSIWKNEANSGSGTTDARIQLEHIHRSIRINEKNNITEGEVTNVLHATSPVSGNPNTADIWTIAIENSSGGGQHYDIEQGKDSEDDNKTTKDNAINYEINTDEDSKLPGDLVNQSLDTYNARHFSKCSKYLLSGKASLQAVVASIKIIETALKLVRSHFALLICTDLYIRIQYNSHENDSLHLLIFVSIWTQLERSRP